MKNQDSLSIFLDEVVSSDFHQYVWLRSLSYLEYIGYRKMVKTVSYPQVNPDVFQHLKDEIQHSYTLREFADVLGQKNKINSVQFDPLSDVAEEYFQGLDSYIHEWVFQRVGQENPFLCYLWTSYIIEKRAMRVYPQYYAKLQASPLKTSIQQIVKDESEHLAYLEKVMQEMDVNLRQAQEDLFKKEEELFLNYLSQMKTCFYEMRSLN